MPSFSLCVGALAFAAVSVQAGPCRPKITSSVTADVTTIAASSVPESTSTFIHPSTFASSSLTFLDTTATGTESTDTPATSEETTITTDTEAATTTAEVNTTGEVTTTAAETTATIAAEPTRIKLAAIGSNDPSLTASSRIGFAELESFGGSTLYYIDFTSNTASNQVFTIGEDTGELKAFNGPGDSAGQSVFYYANNAFSPSSNLNIAPPIFAEIQGLDLLVCTIAQGSRYEFLQCNFGEQEIAEFWTCNNRLNVVKPGYNFANLCDGVSTGYRVPIIQVLRLV